MGKTYFVFGDISSADIRSDTGSEVREKAQSAQERARRLSDLISRHYGAIFSTSPLWDIAANQAAADKGVIDLGPDDYRVLDEDELRRDKCQNALPATNS